MSSNQISTAQLERGVDELPRKIRSQIMAVLAHHADIAEAQMKSNAPWNDQTGNARQGLSAKEVESVDAFHLVLYHSMPYGIWLEVRWSGRYAIILPTVSKLGPQVMQAVRGLMGRM